MAEVPTVPGLPPLDWTHGPSGAVWETSRQELTLTAEAGVDWSNDSLGGAGNHGATLLGFPAPEGDFTLSARVRVAGERSTFDAGVLGLWRDDDHWAKLCFEFSPPGSSVTARRPMVVSVVTDVWSDDVNSRVVEADQVHLRIVRTGPPFAFHASPDGLRWDFVRLFRLAGSGPIAVGFLAQAPMGPTCVARFDRIRFAAGAPSDLRDGS